MDNEIINKSMVFYESFYDATRDLSLERFREVWGAFCEYAFYGIQPEGLSEIAMAIFKMAKPNMDTVVQKRAGGLKGGDNRKKSVEPIGSDMSTHRVTHRVEGANPKGSKAVPSHIYDVDVDVEQDVDIDVDEDVVVDVDAPDATTDNNTFTHSNRPAPVKIIMAFDKKEYRLADDELNRFIKYNDKMGWKKPLEEAVDIWIVNAKPPGAKTKKQPANKFINFDQHEYDDAAIEAALLRKQLETPVEEM